MTSAKKLLVTGANGFVGQALCVEALRRGFGVVGAVRGDSRLPAGVQQTVVGAIDENTNWESALRGVDVVIHLAARVHVMKESATDPLTEFRRVNVAGTEQLARSAAASGVKRFVYISSIKVNGEATKDGCRYSEKNVPAPLDLYGVSKWEAEQSLQRVAKETGLEVVIVRPPLVYGAGVKGNFAQLLKVLDKGIPLPLASVKNLRSLIYLGNFVDALLQCATHPLAAGQTYLVSDGEVISTPDLLRKLGAAMGRGVRLLPCPQGLLRFAGQLTGRAGQVDRLIGSLQIDSRKIQHELHWLPPFTPAQGLQTTAEWYRNLKK